MPHWRSKTEKMEALHEAAQMERWPFPYIEQNRKRVMPSTMQMLEWFLWGVCMGAGWYIIQWLLGKVLH
jgi:hypothetical protein